MQMQNLLIVLSQGFWNYLLLLFFFVYENAFFSHEYPYSFATVSHNNGRAHQFIDFRHFICLVEMFNFLSHERGSFKACGTEFKTISIFKNEFLAPEKLFHFNKTIRIVRTIDHHQWFKTTSTFLQ